MVRFIRWLGGGLILLPALEADNPFSTVDLRAKTVVGLLPQAVQPVKILEVFVLMKKGSSWVKMSTASSSLHPFVAGLSFSRRT